MPDDEDDRPQAPVVRLADVHTTDVLLWWGAQGAEWFSVLEIAPPLILVQGTDGKELWLQPSRFSKRYALQETGRFSIRWRVSPIEAVRLRNLARQRRAPGG